MSQTTMDAAAKARVRDALLAHARSELAALQESVGAEDAAAMLDQDSSFSVDDQSQSQEAGDISGLLQESVAKQSAQVAAIEALDVSVIEQVGPGAIVGFGGNRYVVDVVMDAVSCDGVEYEGISTDSAIYGAIAGLRLGETFSFRGAEHTIDLLA